MATRDIAAAMQRAEAVLRRRPDMGLHDDAPASASWKGGVRIMATNPNGKQIPTDMPTELGGTGDQVTPGWLFRAGLASCACTCIAMRAAAEGVELAALEVNASSRSDTRGILGMTDADGQPTYAGPGDVRLQVRIAAAGVAPERLRQLVEDAIRCSPIPSAVQFPTPMALHIDVAAA